MGLRELGNALDRVNPWQGLSARVSLHSAEKSYL